MKLIASLLVVAMLATKPAHAAGKVVFDPTNFGKNIITAAQTTKHTMQLAAQYQTLVQQYMTMLQNVKQVPQEILNSPEILRVMGPMPADPRASFPVAKDIYQTYAEMRDVFAGNEKALQDLQAWSLDMSRQSSQSGQDWQILLQREIAAVAAGKQSSARNYDTYKRIEGDLVNYQRRADAIAKRIPQNAGAVEALGTLAQQNHLVIDQLSALVSTASRQAQSGEIQAQQKQLQDERDLQFLNKFEQQKAQAYKELGIRQ